MFLWANYFLYRFPFLKPALSRVANYFITSLQFENVDEETQKNYKDAFEKCRWKDHLETVGLNLLSVGNEYASFMPSFERHLRCPSCGKIYPIEQIEYDFKNGKYYAKCDKCGYKGVMELKDEIIRDPNKLIIKHWPVTEILTRHENTVNHTEYYWNVPANERKKILQDNNKFYSKYTPSIVYQTVKAKKALVFSPSNFLHLKMATPTALMTDGRAVPPTMYLFDEFFMHKVIDRQNEAIAYEDINPFRVISFANENTNAASPLLTIDGAEWRDAVERAIEDHRKDPASYTIFPFSMKYEQLGGQGKELTPIELLNSRQANILNGLNIPEELYRMNFQAQQVVGPALRLFENSWKCLPSSYDDFLQKWADVISALKGWEKVKVKLQPITMADNIEQKQILMQLASANTIAKSQMLEIYGLDYREQIRKRIDEQLAEQEITQQKQTEQEIKNLATKSIFDSQPTVNPQDVLSQAQDIARQLYPLNAAQRRAELQKIKGINQQLWLQVKHQLDLLTQQNGPANGENAPPPAAELQQ